MFLQQLPECSLTLLACLLPGRRSRRRSQFGSPLLEKPVPVTAGQNRAFWCSTERLLLVVAAAASARLQGLPIPPPEGLGPSRECCLYAANSRIYRPFPVSPLYNSS